MTSPTLRRLCLVATMTHVLPGSHAELRWPDGAVRVVGHHPSADVGTCVWHDAVVQCAATASLLPHELLFGLAGAPAVTVLPGPDQHDMGGGVYRQGPVDVFATTLAPEQVRAAIVECEAPGRAHVGVRRDELTGVTVVAVGHLVDRAPEDAGLAWSLAIACAIDEVSLTS
jgi:hypothetical protein